MIIQKYPFLIPLLIIWFVLLVIVVLVFHTPFGLGRFSILNRKFMMRLIAVLLFSSFILLLVSGIAQLFGITFILGDRPLAYWHALTGFSFLLIASLHLTYHIKDIWRYLISRHRPSVDSQQQSRASKEQADKKVGE